MHVRRPRAAPPAPVQQPRAARVAAFVAPLLPLRLAGAAPAPVASRPGRARPVARPRRRAQCRRRVAAAQLGGKGGGERDEGESEDSARPDDNEASEGSAADANSESGDADTGSNTDADADADAPPERDWEGSWSRLQKERSGGVFQLPDENPSESNMYDRRVQRLTSAWSNERGFLLGIGAIFLIALFYIYVYTTGGITSSPPGVPDYTEF